MRVLTVFCSVGSRTRMSPTGAGRAPLAPPGPQATIAGCAPVRIWNVRNVLIRDVAPAPVERQLASSVVVVAADVGSSEVAPGTATLFKICGAGAVRASQIVGRCAAVTVAPACV